MDLADVLKAAFLAEWEEQREQINAAKSLRRAEVVFFFDERSGAETEVLFRMESRRRIKQRPSAGHAMLSSAPR